MLTLRQKAADNFRTGDANIINTMSVLRDSLLSDLQSKEIILIEDIQDLDRIGRFTVAQSMFNQCSNEARSYLCTDEHAHVRSAAENAKNRFHHS